MLHIIADAIEGITLGSRELRDLATRLESAPTWDTVREAFLRGAFIVFNDGEVIDVDGLKIEQACNAYLATLNAKPAEKPSMTTWHDGQPPKPWRDEWFIAVMTNKSRVVLKSLPEEYSYQYTTADATYYKADKISKWMQFPDSDFISPTENPPEIPSVDTASMGYVEASDVIRKIDLLRASFNTWQREEATTEENKKRIEDFKDILSGFRFSCVCAGPISKISSTDATPPGYVETAKVLSLVANSMYKAPKNEWRYTDYENGFNDACDRITRETKTLSAQPATPTPSVSPEALAACVKALKGYAQCRDGCTCGDGWDHRDACAALAMLPAELKGKP